jgi:hypothetical protein
VSIIRKKARARSSVDPMVTATATAVDSLLWILEHSDDDTVRVAAAEAILRPSLEFIREGLFR